MFIPARRVPFASLADVARVEAQLAVVDTDDRSQCSEAYGETQTFPDVIERCDYSPTRQHVYGGPGDRECRYCRNPSGLDQ